MIYIITPDGADLTVKLKYYELFAGVGMARMGLGSGWQCLFANDCDDFKQKSYADNWAGEHFDKRDVALVTAADLAGQADLAGALFRCQDLSQVCTNLPATFLVEEMERELGKPVIDSIAVTFWKGCMLAGIDPTMSNWGALMRGELTR
ncbi:hypothetical protein GCM10023067_33650 [Aminobacter aganoensis]